MNTEGLIGLPLIHEATAGLWASLRPSDTLELCLLGNPRAGGALM